MKDYLINNENDLLIKEEIEKIKKELREIKTENNSSKQDNGDSLKIKDELDKINSIMHELRYQKNVNLDTPNYLEYTLMYSLYMTKSYINSRTINHVMIYSSTQTLKIAVSVCIVQVNHMNLIMIYQVVRKIYQFKKYIE